VVSAQGPDLSSPLDERFGRASHLVFLDLETGDVRAIDNGQSVAAPSGAGLRTAQQVADTGAQAVVTGRVGPKALQALRAAGVRIYLAEGGTVAEAAERFRQGQLQEEQA